MGLYGNFSRQAIRFGIVGLASNLLLYLLYLFFTTKGIGHKTTMTLLFWVGALQTFIFNKRWAFDHPGLLRSSFTKYLFAYSFSYLLNLAALSLFVDFLGYPHQLIQGLLIFAIAALLFILQRYWIFRMPVLSKN